MTVISSSLTRFHKRIFPAIWLAIFAMVMGSSIASGKPSAIAAAGVCLAVMGVLTVVLMKKLVWDLADEVQDHGESLLVRKDGAEERIPLANIMAASATTMVNPPRITLRLVDPSRFGREIVFAPVMRFSFNPFATHPVAEDLTSRADLARARRVS